MTRMARGMLLLTLLFICTRVHSNGQVRTGDHRHPPPVSALPTGAQQYLLFSDPAPLACLAAWFPPMLLQSTLDVRAFIRSKAFRHLREIAGDQRAFDAIYVYAMQRTQNNTAAALLIATAATFDHRTVGIKVPLLRLAFPLSNESAEEFGHRVASLPSQLYDDSPLTRSGDRDKLQHFFGSAFLTVVSESRGASERFGEFIEQGEEALIVGGVYDTRDLRADRQGQLFGLRLLQNNRIYPSQFLRAGLRTTVR